MDNMEVEDHKNDQPPRAAKHSRGAEIAEWAWVELNYRPHAYQACALTTELQALT